MRMGERIAQAVQAWLMERVSGRYERFVAARKRELLGGLGGTVVEIGAGTGPNARFYGERVRWIAVEPNPYMHAALGESAREAGRPVAIVRARAESLPMAEGSVDAVVSTLVLCSVGDAGRAIAEARRVLKPGGRLIFVEHVAAAEGSAVRRRQRLLGPLWKRAAGGCRLSQETGRLIQSAGFGQVQCEGFALPLPLVGPHVAGYAVK